MQKNINTRATNSFIEYRVVQELGLALENLNVALNVVLTLCIVVKLGRVWKECALTLKGYELPVNLIVLTISQLEVSFIPI